ncbi:MAG: diguanylate cyclase [Acidobacteriota bacterium]
MILLPFTQDYPVHMQLVKGFRERVLESGANVRICYEYLDLARFPNERAYLADVAAFLKAKYSRLMPDAVVSGGPIRQFMDEYGDAMFPGVPVVFPRDESAALEAAVTGGVDTSRNSEYMKSVEVVFRTRPATKTVYVVLGDSDEERNIFKDMSRVAYAYRERARFVFTNDLTHARMLELVHGAGSDSAILFMRWHRDVQGESFIPDEVLREVAGRARAPVYGVVAHSLEGGVLGGYLFSFELFGRRLAQQSLEALGEATPAGSTAPLPVSEYAFDWRELRRWNVREGSLPQGSRIEFRELSAWDRHGTYILGGVAVVLLETALIVGLAVNRARRKRMESELLRLNVSLEEMVASRTRQLQQANAELELAKRTLEGMNIRLEMASRTDLLTGLFNRRHFEETAPQEHARYVRTGKRFSVVLCDIDFFKNVNDLHGHDAGDRLLRMVGEDLSRSVRPYDILVRWGGEEFLLFLPSTDADLAAAIAERIRQDIGGRVYTYEGHSLRLSATLGVATVRDGESVSEVIRRADVALYEGKRSGRNRVVAS